MDTLLQAKIGRADTTKLLDKCFRKKTQKMRYLHSFFAIVVFITQVKGQDPDTSSYPEVGKPMPDLLIKNIAYYPKKQAAIRDFRGKWLLLDFWDVNCGACIRTFPRMNRIQQKFGNQLQVMMVGVQDAENKIQPLFAKYRKGEHLIVPCAFDSGLAERLDLGYMPHTIVIDDKGIVRSIVLAIDTGQVREFLDGKSPRLEQAYRRMKDYDTAIDRRAAFNDKEPFMVGGNGDNDSAFLYRSLLSVWDPNIRVVQPRLDEAVMTGRFQALGITLDRLYNYAFFGASYWESENTGLYGKYYDRPVLEIKDSTLFRYPRRYCYSLIRPPVGNSAKIMREIMQRDLINFFGFHASIEVRKCPYWKLIAEPSAKDKVSTKGGKSFARELSFRVGWSMGNYPVGFLIDCIRANDPGRDRLTDIYLDETGISGNIDISLDCIMNDLPDLRKALQAYGLDLVKGEKEMQVVVIRTGRDD
jgi:thiol-disulfide isomerase/thioredoxin